MVQLTREQTEEYLEDRRKKGFNAILVNLLERKYAAHPPSNVYGAQPFTTPNDFSTPNAAYFAHADWLIARAAEKGIVVVLNPCYTGYTPGGTSSGDGFLAAMIANGPAKSRNYGRYVGNRYKGYKNIIWQAIGDMTPPPGGPAEKNWLEILAGIKEFAPTHHWTAHYLRWTTARDVSAFAGHMTIDNNYGGNRSYIQTLRAYNRTNTMPTFVNESYYEDTGLGDGKVGQRHLMRAQAYWAMTSGASGTIFGSDHIWPFGSPYSGPGMNQTWDWRAGMNRPPSRDMVHVLTLFLARPWHLLVPDQSHTVVTKGYGTFGIDDRSHGGDYVTAARTPSGDLVMAYVPSTGTAPRTLTVDMSKLSKAATARWFNPTNGTYTTIAGSPLANSGPRDLTTPGNNGTGTNDWVLVLEATATAPMPPARPRGLRR